MPRYTQDTDYPTGNFSQPNNPNPWGVAQPGAYTPPPVTSYLPPNNSGMQQPQVMPNQNPYGPPITSGPVAMTTQNGPTTQNPSGGTMQTGGGTGTQGPNGQDQSQWLLQLLNSGMDPQQAIDILNNYGNQGGTYAGAAYYNDSRGQTIGLNSQNGYLLRNPDGSWGLVTRPNAEGGGGGGGGSAAYGPGGVAGMGSVFSGGGMTGTPEGNALFDFLMGRATGQTSDQGLPALQLDANDPIIKAQVDAFQANQDRSSRNYLAQEAEKKGTNADLSAETRSMAEQSGQATSAFQAQLQGQELNARRQEIQQALSGELGFLTSEQAMKLQEELAQLNLAQQAYQFDTQQQFANSPLGS